MISRNFKIALVISLSVHVFLMSAVVIVTPGGPERRRPYTRVSFLGPILKKTAFDIMLEHANPLVMTTYNWFSAEPEGMYLKADAPGRKDPEYRLPFMGKWADMDMLDFLSGTKSVPDFLSRLRNTNTPGVEAAQRRTIYKPDEPVIIRGLYGDKDVYRMKVRAFVDHDGNVKRTEPVTTTGYPQLDIIAAKFVKGWIFEPRDIAIEDEQMVVEVVLRSSE